MTKRDDKLFCSDPSASVETNGRNFVLKFSDLGSCMFAARSKRLDIHSGHSINCIDVKADGTEILTGDCTGQLFLTHLGTEPVPLPGPTKDMDIEDCIIDEKHSLFFAGCGDFKIYRYSATEYEQNGVFEGHRSRVTRLHVRDNLLVSGSRDRSIVFWDIESAKREATSTVVSAVNDFCFTDGGLILTAADSGVFGLDARTGQSAVSPQFIPDCVCTTIDACGDDLTIGMEDGHVVWWDIRNMTTPKGTWEWYDAAINRIVYHNKNLWCLTNDGTGACIDCNEKKSLIVLGTTPYAALRDIAFRNDMSAWTVDGEGNILQFEL